MGFHSARPEALKHGSSTVDGARSVGGRGSLLRGCARKQISGAAAGSRLASADAAKRGGPSGSVPRLQERRARCGRTGACRNRSLAERALRPDLRCRDLTSPAAAARVQTAGRRGARRRQDADDFDHRPLAGPGDRHHRARSPIPLRRDVLASNPGPDRLAPAPPPRDTVRPATRRPPASSGRDIPGARRREP